MLWWGLGPVTALLGHVVSCTDPWLEPKRPARFHVHTYSAFLTMCPINLFSKSVVGKKIVIIWTQIMKWAKWCGSFLFCFCEIPCILKASESMGAGDSNASVWAALWIKPCILTNTRKFSLKIELCTNNSLRSSPSGVVQVVGAVHRRICIHASCK